MPDTKTSALTALTGAGVADTDELPINDVSATLLKKIVASELAVYISGKLAATYQPLDGDLTALAAISGVQGDVIYHNGTSWVRLGAGTSGQFLKTNGAGANPAWAAAAGSGSVASDAIFDAKGDLPVGTGADTAAKLAVGGNGSIPHADSTSSVGISYGLSPGIRWASTASYFQPGIGQGDAGSQSAATAQTCTWIPFYIERPRTVASIGNYCFTLEAGSTMRLGLYTCLSTNFEPDALIADYGTVSGASTGFKTATGTTVVGPGVFWVASWASNHTTVRWSKITLGGQSALGCNPATGRFYPGFSISAVDYSAGLPATATGYSIIDSASSSNAPASMVRFT